MTKDVIFILYYLKIPYYLGTEGDVRSIGSFSVMKWTYVFSDGKVEPYNIFQGHMSMLCHIIHYFINFA